MHIRSGVRILKSNGAQFFVLISEVLDILSFRLFDKNPQFLTSSFPAAAQACRVCTALFLFPAMRCVVRSLIEEST